MPKTNLPSTQSLPIKCGGWLVLSFLLASSHLSATPVADAAQPLPLETGDWVDPSNGIAGAASAAPKTVDPVVSIPAPKCLSGDITSDRLWLISTRHLPYYVGCVQDGAPDLHVSRLDRCGRRSNSSLDDYQNTMCSDRVRIVYVHGNWRDSKNAVTRGLDAYLRITRRNTSRVPIDWVIWSWPSDRQSVGLSDARDKANRADSQSLYLGWTLHQHVAVRQPTALIGFSFGGRVCTGALHLLAGGTIAGRPLGLPPTVGAQIDVGLLAPALGSTWLSSNGRHRKATQNIDRMVLLYNERDVVLRNYWLLSKVRGITALGYTGPRQFAPRVDGTALPVRAKNCKRTVGMHHSERHYYEAKCNAACDLATLITSAMVHD
ncbi:MAG: hypothetical protein AAGD07_04145 [Planctomycetota bacterium]